MATTSSVTVKPTYISTGKKKWNILYPAYINSKLTEAEGRRIPKDKCAENPNIAEMYEVIKQTGLPCEPEIDKAYPRDFWMRGRLRVALKKENGEPINPAFPTKKVLMQHIGLAIPKLPSRLNADTGKGKGKKGK
eukprot:TRINITY_DN1341_c0_g1_i2.p1 TRINITY_DN1341_c0_g1~~TRINITY_DN1341_c0_g1_i2.p1  ORF type:complete len:135 (-),score=37.30 TRINITY_DN1341_c0_g1_i2:29-433(-)